MSSRWAQPCLPAPGLPFHHVECGPSHETPPRRNRVFSRLSRSFLPLYLNTQAQPARRALAARAQVQVTSAYKAVSKVWERMGSGRGEQSCLRCA